MFGKSYVTDLIDRSAETPEDRRKFLKAASATGLGVVGAGLLGSVAGPAIAASASTTAGGISDATVLNFALNLEYLEAEFYSWAVHGHGLPEHLTHGKGRRGPVVGGRHVRFGPGNRAIRQFALEIARDEFDHVRFLREALGRSAVARPAINIRKSFNDAAHAAGLVGPHEFFNVYENPDTFLLGAFIFEDVGVTAYKGAAPLLKNKTYLSAAAGILAVEAYHAANIRTTLFDRGLARAANAISAARNALDGPNHDQGITRDGRANIVPADDNGIAFGRTPGQVLNIVYLTPKKADRGGFFPHGVNGLVRTSA